MHRTNPVDSQAVVLSESCPAPLVQPLARVRLDAPTRAATRLRVEDGRGRLYVDRPADATDFVVGGAPGWHRARLIDGAGAVTGEWRFRVGCATAIDDGGAGFGALLAKLHLTMAQCRPGVVAYNRKFYRHYVCWLRDHTHVLKGMKYFDPGDLKTGLELYADTQRGDGMVYDRIAPKADVQGWRDYTFREGDFIRTVDSGMGRTYTLQRIPVENDLEFLFIECLYRTWQATGDTEWMARYLDHARRAVAYATTDPYRWSDRFGLLKRGYTIDTWDFMHSDDSALTLGDNICDLGRTTFGVMHGDNTGMAAACRMLATLLRVAGRGAEAEEYDRLAETLLRRLQEVAWDARGYYRHHVSEDPSFRREVGATDESAQVSLSNAYALHRGIGPDKCRGIIDTYQRIRRTMPPASPGEFFHIYPPFEKGFETCGLWEYMNGGVSTIVAGELACGAFKAGSEAYGVDILRRLNGLADRHGGHLNVCFHGNPQTTPPSRAFTMMDLSAAATVTAAFREAGGWGEAGNDLSRMPTGTVRYHNVPFRICPDGRGVGVASEKEGWSRRVRVPVGGCHASMYLLHTCARPQTPAAKLDVHYADGQSRRVYLVPGRQLASWFMPGSAEGSYDANGHAPRLPQGWPEYQLAWRGANDTFENVGTFIWGWDNPRPETPIESLEFSAAENSSAYFVPGITFSDKPVWFPHSDVSYGIPDAWGAAAVVFALVEGLAGVEDASTMFESAEVSPRWSAAGVDEATVCVTYPASGGYVAYRYRHDPAARRITLQVTGSGGAIDCRVLLPAAARAADHPVEQVGESHYARVAFEGAGPHEIEIRYE